MTSNAVAGAAKQGGSGLLFATCVSTLVVNANTSAVSILLPAISEDTGTSIETLQWAVTGYSLVGAAVIVTSGALGDVLGRRKLFIAGIVLFIASCVLIALSQSGGGVIAGRAIQGAAGSTILASGLSLLSVGYSGERQMRAIAQWGAASAIGAAVGPLIGGVLVEGVGWQGLFWLDAAIALVCIPVTLFTIQESRDPNRSRSIDYAGTVLIALILAPLIFAFTEGPDWGWFSPQTIACFAVSIAAAGAFVMVESKVAAPLVNLKLRRNLVLVTSTIAILIGAGTINAMGYLLSIYFQDPAALGFSSLEAGIGTLPATIGLVAVTPLVPKMAVKFGTRQTVTLGFVICTAGFIALALVTESWGYALFVLPVLTVAIGMGLSNGPASAAATASVPETEVGAASGISNMARYVGAAVFVALAASVYASVGENGLSDGDAADVALASGFSAACILLAAISALGIVMGLWVRHKAAKDRPIDRAAAASAHLHTIVPEQSASEA